MKTALIVEQRDAVLHIMLNREDCGNLITMQMIGEMTAALQNLPEGVKLVVLSGKGSDFCKGRDYAAAPEVGASLQTAPTAGQIRGKMTAPIIGLYASIRNLPVPTLAVVTGSAHGFGCALACACDIVLSSESAHYGLPEMGERCLPPTLAMSALWHRVHARALTYLVFSTQMLDARAALQAGLISAMYADDRLEHHASELIGTISRQPHDALLAVKEYLKLAPDITDPARASLGENLFCAVMSSR